VAKSLVNKFYVLIARKKVSKVANFPITTFLKQFLEISLVNNKAKKINSKLAVSD